MNRTNLILTVIVAAMAAFVVFVEQPWSGKKEGYVQRKPLFEDFDVGAVTGIDLAREGQSLTLARSDGAWFVESEGHYPANQTQINQLLGAVRQWKVDARVGTAQKTEKYMVDDTKGTRVTLTGSNGEVIADLYTGRVAGFNAKEAERKGGKVDTEDFGIYVRRADSKDVYFMKGLYLGTFSPDSSTFIDRSLVTYDVAQAERFTATCGGKTLLVTKSGETFTLEGITLPPDEDAIKLLMESFGRLTAMSLEGEYEPDTYGLEPPACVIRTTMADGTEHVLEVGKAKDDKGYYARKPNDRFVVSISKWEVENWSKAPDEFARKRLWDEKQPDLTTMTVTRSGETIRLRKVEDDWKIVTEEVGEIPADQGASWKLINAIANPQVKEYVDPGPLGDFGLDDPVIEAVAETASGSTLRLLVGDEVDDEHVYVKSADSPWVVKVPKRVREDLTVSGVDLKQRG